MDFSFIRPFCAWTVRTLDTVVLPCRTACRRQGGIAANEGYSLLGQQSPHAGAVRGREKARTEALRHGENEVSARAEQPSAGAEKPATEKTEYGTVRHLPFSL